MTSLERKAFFPSRASENLNDIRTMRKYTANRFVRTSLQKLVNTSQIAFNKKLRYYIA